MKRLLFTLAVVPVAFCVFGQADSLAYAVPQNVVIRAQDFSDCHNAALMGDGEAMRRVAVCYRIGVGVGKDLEQAIIWYGKSRASRKRGGGFRHRHFCIATESVSLRTIPRRHIGFAKPRETGM